MRIGAYRVSQILCERFRLDGGAMFGVVPKTLWERLLPADERNRIPMVTRLLLLESEQHRMLIDLGCGGKFDPKFREIYQIEPVLPQALHRSLGELSHVLITHLHFDHVGGVSFRDEDGHLQLSYPQAEHIVSSQHWSYSGNPNPRERASFLADNLEPLASARLTLVSDGEEVLPGVRVFESNGHTRGMLWVEIRGPEDTLLFAADVIPTAHHLPLAYCMGYDMCAETMLEEKRRFLEYAASRNAIIVFEHDTETAAARIEQVGNRSEIKERVALPLYSAEEGQ